VNFFAALGEKVLALAERADTTGRALLAPGNFFEVMVGRIEPGALKLVEGMREFVELMDAVGAKYKDRENAIFWAMAIGHLERKPDPLLVNVLRRNLQQPDFDERPLSELWDLIDHHRSRCARPEESERSEEETAAVRPGIRQYPSVRKALDRHRLRAQTNNAKGQSRNDVLQEMIPAAAYIERAALRPGENLASKVANQIRREVASVSDYRRTARELAAFAEREALLKKGRDARLPPREYELFRFFVDNPGATNAEAAQALGVAVGTVKSMRHRIKNTPEIA
jgi:hypothetical protein